MTASEINPRMTVANALYRARDGLPMSPALDPMTFDELSELYRVEMKSASLTQPRRDLFRAMANLLTALRQEYDRQMSKDPDSVMTEGAEQRRKKAERLCKDIMVLRTRKISAMAIRGAEGGRNALDCLTDEERAYYDGILELTRRQLSEVDRLRGKRTVVETRIDEPPRRDVPPAREPEPPMEELPPEEPPMADEPFDDIPEEDAFGPDDGFVPGDVPEAPDEAVHEDLVSAGPVVETPPEKPMEEPAPVSSDGGNDLEPILIRVLEDLPEFAGPDRDYKLAREDLVTLPRVLADVLVNAGKAARVTPTP